MAGLEEMTVTGQAESGKWYASCKVKSPAQKSESQRVITGKVVQEAWSRGPKITDKQELYRVES